MNYQNFPKNLNKKFKLASESKDDFLSLPICKKVKNILDESSVNEYVKSKKSLERNEEKFTDKVMKKVNVLKDSEYSSIYVVVCLVEQAVILELLKDITSLVSNDIIRQRVYICSGLISIIIMLIILNRLVKKARKQIEKDALNQIACK